MKRKIYEAYIDGGGVSKDFRGNILYPVYGFLITKEAIFLEPDSVIKKSFKPQVFYARKIITNNQSEYLGLKSLVEWLPRNSTCVVYSDSRLVVCQLDGELSLGEPCHFQCHNQKLKRIKNEVEDIIEKKKLKLHLRWVPRERNKFGIILDKIKKKRKEGKLHHV